MSLSATIARQGRPCHGGKAAGGERRIKKKPESFRKRLRQKQRKRGRLTRPLTVLLVDLGGHEGNDHDDAQETAANGENSAIETHTILLALGRDFPKLVLKRLIRPVHTGKTKNCHWDRPELFCKIAELHLNDNGFFDKKIERAGTIVRAYRDRLSVKSMYLSFGNILDDASSSYI